MLIMSRKDRQLFGAALDAMSDKVLMLDHRGKIVLVNRAWREFCCQQGYPTSGLGRTLRSLEIMKRSGPHAAAMLSALDRVTAGMDAEFTCTFRLDASGEKWLCLRVAHIDHGQRASAIITLKDVSDIHFTRQAINDMSLRLASVQQEECQRIALDLHDSTAQHLVAATLNLTGLRSRVALPGAEARLLDDIDRSLQAALHEVRVTSFLLYPSDLGEDGLNATLERFIRTYRRQTGIRAQLRAPPIDELALDLQQAVLRIVQEALTNIHRHARSPRAHVGLRLTRESLILCVADTGRGMSGPGPPMLSAISTGLGIAGMRARAEQLDGELRVKSLPGKGTRILARMPLPRSAAFPPLRETLPSWNLASARAKIRRPKTLGMAGKVS